MTTEASALRSWRAAQCRRWNRDSAHQSRAGQARARGFTRVHQSAAGSASWAAFSARWRARQGLCPLSPQAVQRYLRPSDICAGAGLPLPEGLRVVIWSAWAAGIRASADAWLTFQPPALPGEAAAVM